MPSRLHAPIVAAVLALLAVPALAGTAPQPTWTHYRPGNTGIMGDYVQTMLLDEQDRPWIAAYLPFWEEGGMSRWDGGQQWTAVSSFDHPVIASPRFNDMIRDAGGVMWIASNAGLLRYDPAVGPDSLERRDPGNSPLPADQIVDLALAPDGAIWMAVDGGPGGLVRFDPATDAWQVWNTANGLPWGTEWPGWNSVDTVSVIPDPVGAGFTVWFSNSSLGMGTYRNGHFEWFGVPALGGPVQPWGFMSHEPVDNLGNAWMSTNQGLARRTPDGTITVFGAPAGLSSEISRVVAIKNGRALLGTYYADVFMWDGSWQYLGNWGSGNHTYVLREDTNGVIWAGGIGGASRYENGTWQRYRVTNTGMVGYWVETIAFDAAGNVYMNGNAAPGVGGFDIFDGSTWTNCNDFTYGLGPAWGLPSDDVASICPRADGTVAVAPAGGQGLLEWDGTSFTDLVPQFYTVENVVEDGLGRLWGSGFGGGAYLVDDDGFTQFLATNSPMPAGDVGSITVDPDEPGFVWIATMFGMAHTDGDTWDLYPRELLGLTQNSIGYHVTCADRAPDGTLWIGSGRGIFHFDPDTLAYTQYDPANTPAMPSDEVWEIETLPDGSLLFSTFDSTWPYPGGVTRVDGDTWTTWTADDSPLPHNQVWALNSRPITGGFEVWVGTASEAVAVMTFTNDRPEDVNGDSLVDVADLVAVILAWGPCPGTCPEDVDGNGVVDVADLVAVILGWD